MVQASARACFDFNLNVLARSMVSLALPEHAWLRERRNDRWTDASESINGTVITRCTTENQRRDGCDHRILKGHSHDEVHRMVAIMTDLREVTLFKGI